VVEKNVQDSRWPIRIEANQAKFGSFTELNAWLGDLCRAPEQEVRLTEHEHFSVADAGRRSAHVTNRPAEAVGQLVEASKLMTAFASLRDPRLTGTWRPRASASRTRNEKRRGWAVGRHPGISKGS
jgi:hypothetical protein